jgi:MinD superfamily P-loop ATPase
MIVTPMRARSSVRIAAMVSRSDGFRPPSDGVSCVITVLVECELKTRHQHLDHMSGQFACRLHRAVSQKAFCVTRALPRIAHDLHRAVHNTDDATRIPMIVITRAVRSPSTAVRSPKNSRTITVLARLSGCARSAREYVSIMRIATAHCASIHAPAGALHQ